jgi:hypothetical protein
MKYFTISVLALALSFSLSACAGAKTVKEAPFTVDFDSPKIQAGMVEAQFQQIVDVAGVRTIKIYVDYYPLEDAVCLRYRLDLMTFYLYLDREGREAYVKALKQYKEDYEKKTLKTKGSRSTRRQYGNVEVYLIWQSFAFSIRSRANTFIDFGYDIRRVSDSRASFFVVFRREVSYYDPQASEREGRIAQNEPMYLTRAQADDLAVLFDQDYLKSLTPEKNNLRGDNTFDQY